MARPKSLEPKHIRQKNPGGDRGFVVLSGERLYTGPLGSWGTQEATDTYLRHLAEWIARGRQPQRTGGVSVSDTRTPGTPPTAAAVGANVVDLLAAFWIHAKAFYRRPDGTRTNEVQNFKSILKPTKRLYGNTPIADFGPNRLRALQEELIRLGWSRNFINKQCARLKHVFKWGVSQEIVPPTVYQALATVPGLKRGKTTARETEKVKPVREADVDAVCKKVAPQVEAMIRLQQYTGMRPGEVVMMRTCDIDRTGKVWKYVPPHHKNAHHELDRVIFIGPKAQGILEKWLRPNLAEYLFQPAEAEVSRLEAQHEKRKKEGTPLKFGNRPGTNRVRSPKRKPGAAYSEGTYYKAVIRGGEKAFGMPIELRREEKKPAADATPEDVEAWKKARRDRLDAAAAWREAHCWHPHQLRHTAGTNLRRQFGVTEANVILGHTTLNETAIYAEADMEKAAKVMGEVG